MDELISISISDTTYFMSLSFNKYSSMIEFHVLLANNLICDFNTSLARLTALDWVFDKSEYLILSWIGLNNEKHLLFVGVTDC